MTKKFEEITHDQLKQLYSLYYSLKILHTEKKIDDKKEVLNAVKNQSAQICYIDFSLFYSCVVNGLLFKQTLKELRIKCTEN